MSHKCGGKAVARYTWPGQDEAYVCEEHLPVLKAIANAMGFYLQIIPLSAEEKETDQHVCNQEVKDVSP